MVSVCLSALIVYENLFIGNVGGNKERGRKKMAVSRFSSFRRIYRQRQKNHALDKHMRAEIFSLSLSSFSFGRSTLLS